jgi:dihydrofolate reductase
MGHTVLMGRKTYESLPIKFRPLPGRKNVVCTRDAARLAGESGIEVVESAVQYVDHVKTGAVKLPSEILWVIGGAEIYRQTQSYWDEVYLTLIEEEYEGDAFFPEFEKKFRQESCEKRPGYSFVHYVKNQ